MNLRPAPLQRAFRDQQLYVFIAVGVAAVFWAMNQPINPATIILYSLCIGNLTTPMLRRIRPLYYERPFPQNLIIYLGLLAIWSLPVYAISSAVVWRIAPPSAGQSLAHLIRSGWRFPILVTLLWGTLRYLFESTRDRLELRNRELQKAVEVRTAQIEMQDQELKRALEIQRSLLPKDIPQVAGFEIAATWQPARVVGGDYFDVLKLPDNRLAVCIADVVGKSISAALLMATVQAIVRAFAQDSHSPANLCSRVNDVLCSNIASGKFVTFFYGILDPLSGRFEYSNAGHLPPLLIEESGTVRAAGGRGIVLGIFPDAKYEDASVIMDPGDKLLLFTDGITEAFSPQGEEFGEDRVAAVAQTNRASSAQRISDRLFEEVNQFCQSQFHDDATLMVVSSTRPPVPRPT